MSRSNIFSSNEISFPLSNNDNDKMYDEKSLKCINKDDFIFRTLPIFSFHNFLLSTSQQLVKSML